jgi:hypothetical protein
MIVRQGWGILVLVFALVGAFLGLAVASTIGTETWTFQFGLALGGVIAGVGLWLFDSTFAPSRRKS